MNLRTARYEAAAAEGVPFEEVKHTEAKSGFALLPRRWVVELAWPARFRRMSRDYVRQAATLGAFHFLACACLMLASSWRLSLELSNRL